MGESGNNIGIKVLFEERKEYVADAISGIANVGIAGISTKCQRSCLKILKNIGSVEVEEWSDTKIMPWKHG